jgi:hypothetical protein
LGVLEDKMPELKQQLVTNQIKRIATDLQQAVKQNQPVNVK